MQTDSTLAESVPIARVASDVLDEHANLRRLALAVSSKRDLDSSAVDSLIAEISAHESREPKLFSALAISKEPSTVSRTVSRLRRQCSKFAGGTASMRDPRANASRLVNALNSHLASEEKWLLAQVPGRGACRDRMAQRPAAIAAANAEGLPKGEAVPGIPTIFQQLAMSCHVLESTHNPEYVKNMLKH